MLSHLIATVWLAAGPTQAQVPSGRAQPPAAAREASGQTAASGVPSTAEAYYLFMLGRRLETDGDIEGAIQAHQEAARIDPASAEIPAELAALYARENRLHEAMETAEAALKIDPANVGANRVLGIAYADLARLDGVRGVPDADSLASGKKAIECLEVARRSSLAPEVGLEMELARLYIQTGSPEKAIGVLGRVIVDEPDRAEPIALIIEAYEAAGRLEEAVKTLEGIVPSQPQFYATLGDLQERRQRFGAAAVAYGEAIKQNPGSLDLKTRLAVALLSQNDPSGAGRALELLQQVRSGSPADPRVLYLLAQAQRMVGRLDDSEATARELLRVAPGALTGPYTLALALEQKQQYAGVVAALEPVVNQPATGRGAAGTEMTPLLVHLGFAYVELGDFDRALATFDRARASSPSNPAIDIYTLQAQVAGRRFPEAIEQARRVLASHPDSQRAVRLLAEALRQTGKMDDAVKLLSDALAAHRDDPAAYLALAELDMEGHQYDGALRVLQDAATRFPDNLTVPFQMGAVLERGKRYAEAERKFREVLAKDPHDAPALNYLGYMFADRGEHLNESVDLIQRALQLEPYSGAYLDSLGWAYFKQNRLDLAETNLRKAAEQRTRDSAVQDHLGDLLFKLGRYQEAVSAWERALAGDGEQIDRGQIEKKIRSAKGKAVRR
jgi:tetratricopeptide (TPR) repeat protein